jgi:surface antigen
MSIPGFVDPSPTGAIRSPDYPFAKEDWPKAETALIAAIDADAGADPGADPASWSNEESGRSGSVVGVGARFARAGATCRAFIARIEEDHKTRAAEGAACEKAGQVTISDAAPFRGV